MNIKAAAVAALLLASAAAPAALADSDPKEMLPDPKQEARAEAVGSQLRCLVCQNESIEDSNADLAKDLRAIVRQRIVAGDSNKQIIDWMVARYGNFVRLRPVLGLLFGGLAAWYGRRRLISPPAPLTAAEQARLRELTGAP